jgi:hypothetical protein
MLAYAPPIFGVSTMLFFVQFFFLKFATEIRSSAPGATARARGSVDAARGCWWARPCWD